jgi:pimeloyl-ACP methyl ester carboxylesterase
MKVFYADQGQGDQTLVFIHGLGSYAPAWKENLVTLQQHFRCIVLDLPGYGKSDKGNYPYTMPFFAEVIQSVILKLDLKNPILAGHSMGGQIALTHALLYPGVASKLVLIAPAGFETFHKGERQWFREVMTPDLTRLTTVEQIRLNYAYNFYRMPAAAEFMVLDRIAMRSAVDFPAYCYSIAESVKGMVDYPVFEFLKDIAVPVLVVYGENDNLIPNRFLHGGPTVKVAKQGMSQLKQGELKMIPKAGHFVMFEKADAVNQAMIAFIKPQ